MGRWIKLLKEKVLGLFSCQLISFKGQIKAKTFSPRPLLWILELLGTWRHATFSRNIHWPGVTQPFGGTFVRHLKLVTPPFILISKNPNSMPYATFCPWFKWYCIMHSGFNMNNGEILLIAPKSGKGIPGKSRGLHQDKTRTKTGCRLLV